MHETVGKTVIDFDGLEQRMAGLGAYKIRPSLFQGPLVDNDSALPFSPNWAWSISNPVALEKISLTDPNAEIMRRKNLYLEYGIDEYESSIQASTFEMTQQFILLQCRLGLRICVLVCEKKGLLMGYRIIGNAPRLETLFENLRTPQ